MPRRPPPPLRGGVRAASTRRHPQMGRLLPCKVTCPMAYRSVDIRGPRLVERENLRHLQRHS